MKSVPKIFIIVFLITIFSCEQLFRENEKPINPSDIHWELPTESNTVFENMTDAFQYREYDSYIKCFSDSASNNGVKFIFIPTATVDNPDKFLNWGRVEELVFFQNILSSCSKDSIFQMNILDKIKLNSFGDSVQYNIEYEIKIHHDYDNLNNKFIGSANIMLMKNPQNYWVIYYFEDISISEVLPNWTDLKEYF